MSKSQGGKNAVSVLTSESTSRGGRRARNMKNNVIFKKWPLWNHAFRFNSNLPKNLENMGSVLKDQESRSGQKPTCMSIGPELLRQCDVIYRRKYLYSTRTPDFGMTVVCQSQTPSNYIILYYIILYYIISYHIISYHIILYYIILYYIILYYIILYYIIYYILY